MLTISTFAARGMVVAFGLVAASACAKDVTVSIAHVNDVYHVLTKDGDGGLDKFAAYVKAARHANPALVVTFGGDTLSPSTISASTKGKHMIDAWNLIKPDVAAIGNHEFDHGFDTLQERLKESNFPWIVSNVTMTADGKQMSNTQQFFVKKIHAGTSREIRIAFISALATSTKSPKTASVNIVEPGSSLCELAKTFKAGPKPHVVVGLTHLDKDDDVKISNTCDAIDLILGGHEHYEITEKGAHSTVYKAGSDAKIVYRFDITVDAAKQKVKKIDFTKIGLTSQSPTDKEVWHVGDKVDKLYLAPLRVTIGETKGDLDGTTATVRAKQSGAGYLVADSYRQAVGAQIGMLIGGGLRSDAVLKAGKIEKLDVKDILPFDNEIQAKNISGAKIQSLMDQRCVAIIANAALHEIRGYLHVSGMTAECHKDKSAATVTINGRPLVAATMYTVALDSYLATGGDGLTELGNLENASAKKVSSFDAVVGFIKDHGTTKAGVIDYTAEPARVTVK